MMKEYFSRLPLPECAVKVNDEYLERTIVGYRTSSVSGRNELSSDLFEKTIGDTGPTKYLYKKDKTRDILVQFTLVADSRFEHEKLFNKLKGVLHADNSKFVFEDEPDVYYVGTVRDITCTRLDSSGSDAIASVGEIAIHCSDPYKYSTVEKKFTADLNADGILEMTIKNSGTKAVPIDYTITHNHENGYIGIVSENGVIQLGKIEEADGENYTRSESLASLESIVNCPDDHGTNFMHPNHVMNGSLISDTIDNRLSLRLKTIGAESSGRWCGGMRTLIIPPDSEGVYGAKNFYCYLYHWFETGLMGQTAEQSIAFLTEDNKVICGYSLYKTDMTGNTACLEMWANGKVINSIDFTASGYDEHNPYNHWRGHNDIRKEGEKLTFFWWGGYPSFIVPEVKNMKCFKIQVAFTQYSGRGIGDRYVTRNYLQALSYQKLNVEKWKDVPNRYQQGDVIFINGSESKMYVNGMNRVVDEIKGSKYFLAPPGSTKILFYNSSFCSPVPTITGKIREAWL